VIASKKAAVGHDGEPVSGRDFLAGIDRSLSRMGLEYLDIYQIHALTLPEYEHAIAEIVPAMLRAREAGKIRHIGVTEMFIPDPGHAMFSRALGEEEPPWEVAMTGFNLLNPSARRRVFPRTRELGIGTVIMFAVRRALSRPDKLRELLDALEKQELLAPGELPRENPLGFLLGGEGRAASLPEAAYRFCRHEPGADVVLVGTGSVEHLEENARAILAPPLPEEDLARLESLFGSVDCVSGN
jgi:aryl-alcohol dehydrogenase-like predicted oxidoreductase